MLSPPCRIQWYANSTSGADPSLALTVDACCVRQDEVLRTYWEAHNDPQCPDHKFPDPVSLMLGSRAYVSPMLLSTVFVVNQSKPVWGPWC